MGIRGEVFVQGVQGFQCRYVATCMERKGAHSRTRPVHRKSELERIICDYKGSQVWWHRAVMLATWEADAKG